MLREQNLRVVDRRGAGQRSLPAVAMAMTAVALLMTACQETATTPAAPAGSVFTIGTATASPSPSPTAAPPTLLPQLPQAAPAGPAVIPTLEPQRGPQYFPTLNP